jgi:predicted amidohydrolase YtcJ
VVHFALSTEDQVTALARAGAIVTANPYYPAALADKYSEFGLGPERANSMVRAGSVERAGVPIALHSDMPMAPADPLFLAWCAVNRTTLSGRTADPTQRLSVDTALRAVTIESAAVLDKESEIGSIKPGKRADFAILAEDPYTVDPGRIKDIPVWGVVFEGRALRHQ